MLVALIVLSSFSGVAETAENDADASVLAIVTDKYKQEARDLILDFNTPLSEETIQRVKNLYIAWELETFGPYEEELRKAGATDEQWIKRGAKWLYAYDESTWLNPFNPDEKFQNYISREDIIKYVLAGKSKNVFCDPDGRPIFLMVNMTDKMKQGLIDGLELFVNDGLEGVYDYFYKSGSCVLFAALLEPEEMAGRALLNEFGVTGFNLTEDNTIRYKAKDMAYVFGKKVMEEAFGIDFYQVFVDTAEIYATSFNREPIGACEVFKKNIAGRVWLAIKNDAYMNKSGTGLVNSAKKDYFDSTKVDWYNREQEIMLAMFRLAGENLLYSAETITILNGDTNARVNDTLVLDLASDRNSLQLSAAISPIEATQKVSWKSSNRSVATVSDDGLVTGINKGTAIITATTTDDSNHMLTCNVRVTYLAKEIIIIGNDTLAAGKRITLKAEFRPKQTSNKAVDWESSNPDVATVDKNGKVIAKQVGEEETITITATAKDGSGIIGEWNITVTPAE